MSDISHISIAELKALVDGSEELDEELLYALEKDPRAGARALAEKWRRYEQREKAEKRRLEKLLSFERRFWVRGVRTVAGVDEAGRGPLAGPVVAAAVVLPKDADLPGLDDSKKLNPKKREELFDRIKEQALAVGIGRVENDEIDRIGILQASLKAMREAIHSLSVQPDRVLIDGRIRPGSDFPEITIVDGDALCLSIAAASVVAKVTRDRVMVDYDSQFPAYGFARHKGYGTKEHLEALRRYGPCQIHRRSFRIVADLGQTWSEDFLVFREGLSQVRDMSELESLGRAIRSVREELPRREILELRRIYRDRRESLTRTGLRGEDLAVELLKRKGFRILERNFRAAGGEIDIIAEGERVLAFVEVKTDRTGIFGPPETWVDKRKQRQIAKVATRYLQENDVGDVDLRFDVIGVRLIDGKGEIKHIENAFWV